MSADTNLPGAPAERWALLWEAVKPHPLDPGTLGEYAQLLTAQGDAAASQAFGEVALHLIDCESCQDLLAELRTDLLRNHEAEIRPVQAPTPADPAFKVGDRVRLRSDRTVRGWIVGGPRTYRPAAQQGISYEYDVGVGDEVHQYGESALDAATAPTTLNLRWESRDELLRDLLLAKLQNPLTDSLYAYRASRTDFEPYQFRPALKFLRNPEQRLLIADEVGLGKTIEAAIIYLELKARMDISRALVLCPSRLTGKWQDELRNRFEEEFNVLNATAFRRMLEDDDRMGGSMPIHAIASFELLRRSEFIDLLGSHDLALDLLIVDEAHHMRNAGANTYEAGNLLVNMSDAVLFLSATPLHLGNQDLFTLLNLLAPDEFDNQYLFEEQVRPNRFINDASRKVETGDLQGAYSELKKVEGTVLRDRFLQNPYYIELLNKLSQSNGHTTLGDQIGFQRELLGLNTLGSVFTRTRKREVTHAATRAAFSVLVTLTEAEQRFYRGVLSRARGEMRSLGAGALGFGAVMKERQAASCLAAMREAFEEAHRHGRDVRLEADISPFDVLQDDDGARIPGEEELLRLSRQIGDHDSKFDLFRQTIDDALADDGTSKALVFSYFRRTLQYLYRRLKSAGYQVTMIHGDVKVEERRRIIQEFRTKPEIRILLSSEVGAEGLDFQFCDVLVNYDLPWNPMQVEQRIGRLDRFGQTHERIRIYNFYIENTIETRIFQRLYNRIRIFEESVGDLEDILGEEIRELSRRVLQANLTPDEEERLANAAAARILTRQQEEEELDRHKDELLGQGRILDQQIEETVNSGRVIQPNEVQALILSFLKERFPRVSISQDDQDPCCTLSLDVELTEHLRSLIQRKRIRNRMTDTLRIALNEQRRLPITFDSDLARERPLLEFVTVRHPLAEAARDYWLEHDSSGTIPAANFTIEGAANEVGEGHFFIYLLNVGGVVPRVTLEPVIILDNGETARTSATALLREMHRGENSLPSPSQDGNHLGPAHALAAGHIARLRDTVEAEARQRNEALLSSRAASIRASFAGKIRRTTELLSQATEERIRRMRTAQVRNLQMRMQLKLDDLEKNRAVAVSSSLIACGRLRIVPRHEAAIV